MNKIEEAVDEIKKRLSKIKSVFAVILYGSVARGDYSVRHSDIDILIIGLNVDKIIDEINIKFRVNIHAEYQDFPVKGEDQTLLCKMFEEGKVLFSKGLLFIDKNALGLTAFRLYRFDTSPLDMVNRVIMSRALHSYVIDDVSVVSSGRGGLLVRKDKFKDIVSFFDRFKVKYKVVRTLYG